MHVCVCTCACVCMFVHICVCVWAAWHVLESLGATGWVTWPRCSYVSRVGALSEGPWGLVSDCGVRWMEGDRDDGQVSGLDD